MENHIKDAISKVVEGIDLNRSETKKVFSQIMSGNATNAQIASFITALRMKKETPEEWMFGRLFWQMWVPMSSIF